MSARLIRLGPILLVQVLFACSVDQPPLQQFLAAEYSNSFASYLRLAESGDPSAMNFVGIHYYLGTGVAQDFTNAARWFERAALALNADAARNLGTLYMRGLGVPRNNVYAYGWLYQASIAGNVRALEYLEQAERLITPNQTMIARRWVTKVLTDYKKQ